MHSTEKKEKVILVVASACKRGKEGTFWSGDVLEYTRMCGNTTSKMDLVSKRRAKRKKVSQQLRSKQSQGNERFRLLRTSKALPVTQRSNLSSSFSKTSFLACTGIATVSSTDLHSSSTKAK